MASRSQEKTGHQNCICSCALIEFYVSVFFSRGLV